LHPLLQGDLLDFKFDGSSVQTFDGVDYSKSALDRAKADAEMLGIFDIGKRERKEANYNENSIYRQQMTALQSAKKKKKKSFKLPKHLRLPRMEEWQMFNRDRLFVIQEEEETAFKNLPEEDQKRATMVGLKEESPPEAVESGSTDAGEEVKSAEPEAPFELPPMLSEELRAEKDKLLSEGFIEWKRNDYTNFVKASAKYGRKAVEKIALEVGKPEPAVRDFATAFWGDLGRTRIAEHEYDRVTKIIERGEKKIEEMNNLERATRILVDHFDNPWQELEFTHVNCKDKMYTAEEDRHLLCWARKVRIRLIIRLQVALQFHVKALGLNSDCLTFAFAVRLRSVDGDQECCATESQLSIRLLPPEPCCGCHWQKVRAVDEGCRERSGAT